ncbi:unnamed protein product, partial [marine sediment metagenome]
YKKLRRRKVQPFAIEEPDIDELLNIIPFWKDKSLIDGRTNPKLLKENLITGISQIASLAPNVSIQVGTTEGHLCAGYVKLLKLGYTGIVEKAELFQSQLDTNENEFQDKNNFYEAVKIYYKAAIAFSIRFSALSLEMAKTQINSKRKKELITIGNMMSKFAKNAPETFYEAIQFIWFTQNIINIVYQRSVVALGRLDQILLPYYMRDIENGTIDREKALELIEELNLKLTWNVTLLPNEFTLV